MNKKPAALLLLLLLLDIATARSTQSASTTSIAGRQNPSDSRAVNTDTSSALQTSLAGQIQPHGKQLQGQALLDGLSPVVPAKTPDIDSRVTQLESNVNGIKNTLELLLNWLCEVPSGPNAGNNVRTAAGTLACNSNKKVNGGQSMVVEEPSIAVTKEKVDKAPRTRSQTADDDGWTTVGGGNTNRNQGSSGRPAVISGPISVTDLHTFTEELLQKDTNNVASQIQINRQGQTNSRAADDKAQGPLVTIPSSALNNPTIVAFQALLDNYDPSVTAKEVENNAEKAEQNTFLNEVMKTQVMQHTEHFLTSRGKIRRPLKDVLKEIWFTMYRRAGRNEGSSGFEHSFIGELKDGKVSGFHNWIQFGHEESDGDLDYKGFMKYVNLGNKGQIVKGRFNWLDTNKPVGSLFVGTSPELEMSLYTVCFLIKPDQQCQVKLNKKKFNIQTWTHSYKGKKLIGSAYPDI